MNFRNPKTLLWMFLVLLLAGGVRWFWFDHQIYFNAHILTMNANMDTAEAVVVNRGVIDYVGSLSDARQDKRWYTEMIDLNDAMLLPGFIDSHSHFLSVGVPAIAVDLNPPPSGKTASLGQLYRQLAHRIESTPVDEWIIGFNYDNTVMQDGEHPDLKSLDALSTKHPIFVRHNSGHMGVANTRALQALSIVPGSSHATSKLVGKYADGSFNGLLQETSAPGLGSIVQRLSWLDYWRMFRLATREYASQGYTTVQDGGVGVRAFKGLGWLSRARLLPLRIVVWPSHEKMGASLLSGEVDAKQFTTDYFTTGAVKIVADGSPQGYTAYLSQPYHVAPGDNPEYRGFAHYSTDALREAIDVYRARGWQVAVHANGDAAIDDVLQALEESPIQSLAGNEIILVHAQTIRQDQLHRLAQFGITPSFFPSHTYYWGDWHRERTLGPERSVQISPLASAADSGLRYSIHTDAPVTPTSVMQLLWSATERQSTTNRSVGLSERISRLAALRAMTSDAAWQAQLGDSRGSIEAGKFADFVLLSDNLLTVQDVRSVNVLRTIVGGRTVYQQ